MSKYHFIYLIWLLPLYFVSMSVYQLMIFNGIDSTFSDGQSYIAEVIDFDVKQIAAQTNGYVVLEFTTNTGERIEQQLGLPVQMAQVIMDYEVIPVRYKPDSFKQIVMIPVYELQRNVVKMNLGVTTLGFLMTLAIAFWATRFANRKIREGDEELVIEHLDKENEEN